tara:strand:- start:49 stop:570 length:522 start_codon:yes stop_codon:yes gene_type:complete
MFIYEDYIDKKICKDLIDCYENNENKTTQNDNFKKMSEIYLNCEDKKLNNYFSALYNILKKYIKKYEYIDKGQEPWYTSPILKIQKYKPGESYFGWHTESTGYQGNNNRILAFSTFLNDIKKGGETEFFYQKQKIKPETGKTILFPSFWTHTHRGIVTQETKYIITGWYTYVH